MTTATAQEKGRLGMAAGNEDEGVTQRQNRNRSRPDSSHSFSALIDFKARVLHHGGRLSANARLVGLVIADHVYPDQPPPFPSVATLGSLAALSERAARRATRELEDAGLIIVDEGGGRRTSTTYTSNRYRLVMTDTACPGGSRCTCPRPEKPTRQRSDAGRARPKKIGKTGVREPGLEAPPGLVVRATEERSPDSDASLTRTEMHEEPGLEVRRTSHQRNSQQRSAQEKGAARPTSEEAPTDPPKATSTNVEALSKYLKGYNIAHGTRHEPTPIVRTWIKRCREAGYSEQRIVAAGIVSCLDDWYSGKEPSWPLRFPQGEQAGKSHIDDLNAKIEPGAMFPKHIVAIVKRLNDPKLTEFFNAGVRKNPTTSVRTSDPLPGPTHQLLNG